MKLKLLLSTVMALSLAGAAYAADETPLTKEMSTINKNLRLVKRQAADPAKKQDNLDAIAKVRKALDTAHGLDPRKTKDQADKAAYTKKYKEQMVELGKAVGELEAAIKVDKADDAKKALDRIYALKDKGHKDFGVDDE